MDEGVILKALSGFYYVKSNKSHEEPSSEKTVRCIAKGRFRLDKTTPLVGDKVIYAITEQGKGVLTDILPRKNTFIRPPIANIDKLVIVVSKTMPATDPYLIDKMTVIALSSSCNPVICINKIDINDADDMYNMYLSTGFSVVRTSAVTGSGIDELFEIIKGSICALCGNSGVGKSSIINILDRQSGILTGDISDKLGRGRHTTRHTQFYELPCGTLVADTPGFSVFDAQQITSPEDLQSYFPEYKQFLGDCRFTDCVHINEPGCAITKAIRNGQISTMRHESYKRLYKQASEFKSWEN